MATAGRPYPPGRYPVVVVGSGPGGLQTSYLLARRGIEHAVISRDPAPAGMFRRFPLLERLNTWSKPFATVERESPEFERYDWNSLLTEGDDRPIRVAEFMEGGSYFPARAEMERSLRAFAERFGVRARYGCSWESTERTDDGFVLHTSDGDYSCRVAIFAIGAAQPWRPSIPGLDQAPHYADVKDLDRCRGKRVFIAGKRNAAFEIADGLLPIAAQVIMASPRPANLSILTRSTAGARAKYLQVYEDAVLGGGSYVLDAAIDRVERHAEGWTVHLEGTSQPRPITFGVDEVIACTGWNVPLQDLPAIGLRAFYQGRLPALTPYWESATVPGLFFAGSPTMGAVGLKRYGIPSNSAAVHGFRYNARVLVQHIGERFFDKRRRRPAVDGARIGQVIADELARSGTLWNQQAYLARVFEAEDGGIRDAGVRPLQAFVDGEGPDSVAATVETTGDGIIRPVLYVRRAGAVEERPLPDDPLLEFGSERYREEIERIVKGVLT